MLREALEVCETETIVFEVHEIWLDGVLQMLKTLAVVVGKDARQTDPVSAVIGNRVQATIFDFQVLVKQVAYRRRRQSLLKIDPSFEPAVSVFEDMSLQQYFALKLFAKQVDFVSYFQSLSHLFENARKET